MYGALTPTLKSTPRPENLGTVQVLKDIKDLENFTFDAVTTSITKSTDDKIRVTIDNAPKDVYSIGKKDGKFYIKTDNFSSFIK